MRTPVVVTLLVCGTFLIALPLICCVVAAKEPAGLTSALPALVGIAMIVAGATAGLKAPGKSGE